MAGHWRIEHTTTSVDVIRNGSWYDSFDTEDDAIGFLIGTIRYKGEIEIVEPDGYVMRRWL